MIYFNEEKQAWAFDKVTDLEQEKVLELGYRYLIPHLSVNIVKQLMENAQSQDHEVDLTQMDKGDMFNA